MTSFELLPKSLSDISNQLDFIDSKRFDFINIPDIKRFEIRSYDVSLSEKYQLIPHIRAIDFELNEYLLSKISKFKHVLLISGDKNSDFFNKTYNTSLIEMIKFLKENSDIQISVAFDQYRSSLKEELNYLDKKLDAGADYIFSQPFFDVKFAETVLNNTEKSKFFIGISPVVGEKGKSYWENINNAFFPKHFNLTYEYNISLALDLTAVSENQYFMPIGIDLNKFFCF